MGLTPSARTSGFAPSSGPPFSSVNCTTPSRTMKCPIAISSGSPSSLDGRTQIMTSWTRGGGRQGQSLRPCACVRCYRAPQAYRPNGASAQPTVISVAVPALLFRLELYVQPLLAVLCGIDSKVEPVFLAVDQAAAVVIGIGILPLLVLEKRACKSLCSELINESTPGRSAPDAPLRLHADALVRQPHRPEAQLDGQDQACLQRRDRSDIAAGPSRPAPCCFRGIA